MSVPAFRPGNGVPAGDAGRVCLTEEGRRLLEERIALLAATVDEMRTTLDDPDHGVDAVEAYYRAVQELAKLRSQLVTAGTIDDVADDPQVVELGDTVVIRLDDGTEETYILVEAVEASVEDRRISVEAPLGRALRAKRVGETVDVPVPASYRCTILSATRNAG